jgi:hypothetical protein
MKQAVMANGDDAESMRANKENARANKDDNVSRNPTVGSNNEDKSHCK